MACQAFSRKKVEELFVVDIFHGAAEELEGATDCQGILAGWAHLKDRRATSHVLVGCWNIAAFVEHLQSNHIQKIVAPSLVHFHLGSNKDESSSSKVAFVCHLQVGWLLAPVGQQWWRSEFGRRAPSSSYTYSNNIDRRNSNKGIDCRDCSRIVQLFVV